MTMYPTKVAPTLCDYDDAVALAVLTATDPDGKELHVLEDTYMRVEAIFEDILKRLGQWDIEFVSRKQHWIALANGGRIYVENMAVPKDYKPDLTIRVRH